MDGAVRITLLGCELEPQAYLRRLFTELPALNVANIEALLQFRSAG